MWRGRGGEVIAPESGDSVAPLQTQESPPDARMIAGTRFFLAMAGLAIVLLVPWEVERFYSAVLLAVVVQTAYAGTIYVLEVVRGSAGAFMRDFSHWLDLGWYLLLITLTGGANSVFFYGLFLPILVASFRRGFGSGMRLTLVSASLFLVLGYAAAPPEPEFEAQRFLIRPAFTVALGYMIASRGGFELRLRKRLQLLKDVGTVSNPRFGIDRTAGLLMRRLLGLYDADGCALIMRNASGTAHELRRITSGDREGPVPASTIPEALASRLVRIPPDTVVAFTRPDRGATWVVDASGGERRVRARRRSAAEIEVYRALATDLDAESFAAASLDFPRRASVSLSLAFRNRHRLEESDAAFLVQVLEHSFPLIENIRLVDRLAAGAAQEERRKIARDLHDSVVQPYVGLRIALAGLRQKAASPGRDVSADVERLIDLANLGIEDLRRRVSTLRDGSGPAEDLVSAVSRFAARYSDVTGIAVDIVAGDDVEVSDRVAEETFQMVAEGLSNVLRHSGAARATVRLRCVHGRLLLAVEDEGAAGGRFSAFRPRTISERAEALGGCVLVSGRDGGGATVRVEIPL